MERTKMTEIQELREALKRNKAELQQKNRELEIVAAFLVTSFIERHHYP